MRHKTWMLAALISVAACGSITSYGGGGGGGDGGGGGGGPSGHVVVGNDLFRSAHNGTQNPAVDTVDVGTTVTWTWTSTGSISHSVESEATPAFQSSAIKTGNGQTYSVTFDTPGTYEYDCLVHGAAMRGRIVVRDPTP